LVVYFDILLKNSKYLHRKWSIKTVWVLRKGSYSRHSWCTLPTRHNCCCFNRTCVDFFTTMALKQTGFSRFILFFM